MPAAHLYPNPSDPCPNFMFGQFDLDEADPGSPVMLGEALLRVQRTGERSCVLARSSPRRLGGAMAPQSRTMRRR